MLGLSDVHNNNSLEDSFCMSKTIFVEPLTQVTVLYQNHSIVSQSYPIKKKSIISISRLNCTKDLYIVSIIML